MTASFVGRVPRIATGRSSGSGGKRFAALSSIAPVDGGSTSTDQAVLRAYGDVHQDAEIGQSARQRTPPTCAFAAPAASRFLNFGTLLERRVGSIPDRVEACVDGAIERVSGEDVELLAGDDGVVHQVGHHI